MTICRSVTRMERLFIVPVNSKMIKCVLQIIALRSDLPAYIPVDLFFYAMLFIGLILLITLIIP